MKKTKKLSTRGIIGFVPSLVISLPILVGIIVFGTALFILAKIFEFVGIIEALEYQYHKFKEARFKNKLIK